MCAWCGEDMGGEDGKGVEGVTHGVCNECLRKLKAKAQGKQSLRGGLAACEKRDVQTEGIIDQVFELVGHSGLEPETPVLSGLCSNQLS